jgi:hypothetical protein
MVFNLTHSQIILQYKENGRWSKPYYSNHAYTIVIMGQSVHIMLRDLLTQRSVEQKTKCFLELLFWNLYFGEKNPWKRGAYTSCALRNLLTQKSMDQKTVTDSRYPRAWSRACLTCTGHCIGKNILKVI